MFAYCRNNPASRKDASGTDDVRVTDGNDDDNPLNDYYGSGGASGGGVPTSSNYATAYNPIDAGYSYKIDMSQASNSAVTNGGLYNNGYTASGTYSNPNGSTQATGTYQFQSEQLLNKHYRKHNPEMGYKYNSPQEYLADANEVIQNGQYYPERNAYIRFYNYWGGSNYQFVGMTHDHRYITTFHIKSGHQLF